MIGTYFNTQSRSGEAMPAFATLKLFATGRETDFIFHEASLKSEQEP